MSAPHSNHSDRDYPEDGVTRYPHKKGAKSKGPLHTVANRLTGKARALRKAMDENGGRHGTAKKVEHFQAIKDHVSGGKKSKGFRDPFWYSKK